MNVVRKLALGCLLAVALAYSAVAAAPQNRADTSAPLGYAANQGGPYNRNLPQSAQLAHQYVAAEKPEEKKEIRKKLSDALSQQFDLHIREQQKELDDLEKQLAGLKTVLKKRLEAKVPIVERRVEQLIQEAEGLGWNAPSRSRDPYDRNYSAPSTLSLPSATKNPK